MKVRVIEAPLSRQKSDAWILLVLDGRPLDPSPADPVRKRLGRMVAGWIKTTGFQGQLNEVSAFPSWESLPARFVILAGLGSKDQLNIARLQQAVASAARKAKKLKLRQLAVSLAGWDAKAGRYSAAEAARALVTGAQFGRYDFSPYLSSPRRATKDDGVLTLTDAGRAGGVRSAADEAAVISEIIAEVRDLANQPANAAHPPAIVRAARSFARRYGLSCSVMDDRQLRRKGFGGLLAVAQGSPHSAHLITLKYRGTRPGLKPAVFIGKTITFDTGGISLKAGKNMEWMKFDKSGGMAVLAAMMAAARLRGPRPVVGMLVVAENMPGGSAIRPGDIITSCAGKTIEVVNTDAEGRLVLADALTFACRLKPAAVIDLATLTGAVIVALGHVVAAVMGNSRGLIEQLREAGRRSGDRLWPLPLLPEYGEGLRSQFADMKNVSGDGAAGTLVGAAFLNDFVPADVPWAHVDIAGTAWKEKETPYQAPGTTLFGAKLLLEWLKNLG